MHDGLQEWMRPDEEFDCAWDERTERRLRQGAVRSGEGGSKQYFLSGVELMKRIAQNPQVRTMLLGHTHYNQLEVLQNGDELLPGQFKIDAASAKMLATLEVQNPIRALLVRADRDGHATPTTTRSCLPMDAVTAKNDRFARDDERDAAECAARARRARRRAARASSS